MNLVVDIGNSRAKLAVFNKQEIVETFVMPKFSTSDIQKILKKFSHLKFAIVSNVGAHGKEWYNFLSSRLNCKALSIELPIPITLDYKTPETIGTDRIAAVAGAHFLYPNETVLIIDAGTCIKYDLMDKSGCFQGGAIAPGMNMRFKALKDYTAKLPSVEPDYDYYALTGKSTRESILSGTQIAMINEIKGFISAYTEQYPNIKIVICGGDTEYLAKALKNHIFAIPNLTLIGLNYILNYNANKS
jgi:type III pantothenate kinase